MARPEDLDRIEAEFEAELDQWQSEWSRVAAEAGETGLRRVADRLGPLNIRQAALAQKLRGR